MRKYPLRNEYEIYVRNLDRFVFDDVLKGGKPVFQANNPKLLRVSSGGKAIVYEIEANNQKKYALKCWVEDLGDLKIRYKKIDDYLKQVSLPYFVDFCYKEEGILVSGEKFPIVRMEWVNGVSLKAFIANNLNRPNCIHNLAKKFVAMVQKMHQNDISHGDLQHGNIMIRDDGEICLIDYDSLCIPDLINEKDIIKGLDGYQHPNRHKLTCLSLKVDYFSELVIYLSLLAIAETPDSWAKIEDEERLLFSKEDFLNPALSSTFKDLVNTNTYSPQVVFLAQRLQQFCQQQEINDLSPLEELVYLYKDQGNPIDQNFIPRSTSQSPYVSRENENNLKPYTGTQRVQHSFSKPKPSTSWSRLDTKTSASWDKMNRQQDVDWKKIESSPPPQPKTNDDFWSALDKVLDDLVSAISSAWTRFLEFLSR